MRIGVLADTHGLLRPEVLAALRGVDALLHAGDVGKAEILTQLATIAPVTAIRGNVDTSGPCSLLPETEVVAFDGLSLYMLHDLHALDLNPAAAGFAAVICGHSHQPRIEYQRGVLVMNPGSAGPKRFTLPVSVGFLTIQNGQIEAELKILG